MIASQRGHMETARILLDHGAHVNMQDRKGWSSLMMASQNGHLELALLLIERGANVNMQDREGWSSLILSSHLGHTETVSFLIQNGAEVNMHNNEGLSSLMVASQGGHKQTVMTLIQHGADVNKQDYDEWSSLMIASQNGHRDTVSMLLQSGAYVNMQNNRGDSSLICACVSDDLPCSQLLLASGADINLQNNRGGTALMAAITKNNVKMAQYLINCDADLNIVSIPGESALTLATRYKVVPVIQQMINVRKLHSDLTQMLNHQDLLGNMALMIASFQGQIEIIELLLKAGARVNISNFTDYSSLHLSPQEIQLPEEAEPDIIDKWGDKEYLKDSTIKGTALDIAILQGNTKVTAVLLKNEAKVHSIFYILRSIILNQAQKSGNRGAENLMETVAFTERKDSKSKNSVPWDQYYTILKMLLSNDSDLVNRVQRTKPSTLYLACAFGTLEVVSLLLELGVDVSDLYRETDNGMSYWTSLITLISSGALLSTVASKRTNSDILDLLCHVNWLKYDKILSLLLAKGLDVNYQDNSGLCALSIASSEGHLKLSRLLLKWRANTNLQNKEGVSSLMQVSARGYDEICQLLLSNKAEVDLQSSEGMSSLMEASARGHKEICRLLLQYKAKVDLQDKKNWSALMLAVTYNHVDIAFLLLEKGAQINLQDINGTSSLMLSCFAGHTPVVKVLLQNDVDINLQNNDGITALMMSSYKGHTKIVELLVKYGADRSIVTNIGMTALDFSQNRDITDLLGGRQSLGKRTTTMRDPTITCSEVILHNLQDSQIQLIEQILQAFSSKPSSEIDTSNLVYYEVDQKPILKDAYNLLRDCAYQWESIGALLDLENHTLRELKHDYDKAEDCLLNMLAKWLKRAFPKPTWGELKEALEEVTYGTVNFPQKILRN